MGKYYRMTVEIGLVLFALLMFAGVGRVEARSASDVYTSCSSEDTYQIRRCINWITGASNMYHMFNQFDVWVSLKSGGKLFEIHSSCIPNGVNFGQLQLMFSKWGREHPEDLHGSAASMFVEMIKAKFPCKETKTVIPSDSSF